MNTQTVDTMTTTATTQTATLSARNLRKVYRKRTVVKDVSFDVKAGEVVGLLGPNGAGKTTCFYMVVGLVPADGGNITLAGIRFRSLTLGEGHMEVVSILDNTSIHTRC